MTGLDGHECACACGADFVVRRERAFNCSTIGRDLDGFCRQINLDICWCGTQKFDRIVRSYSAGRCWKLIEFHQMICRCPIAVTIQQRSNDSTIQHAWKRFMKILSAPRCNDFVCLCGHAFDLQTLGI